MRRDIASRLLHLNSRYVGHRGYTRTANALAWLIWGKWQCRFRHALVPKLTYCFRCGREWDSWDEVPK